MDAEFFVAHFKITERQRKPVLVRIAMMPLLYSSSTPGTLFLFFHFAYYSLYLVGKKSWSLLSLRFGPACRLQLPGKTMGVRPSEPRI